MAAVAHSHCGLLPRALLAPAPISRRSAQGFTAAQGSRKLFSPHRTALPPPTAAATAAGRDADTAAAASSEAPAAAPAAGAGKRAVVVGAGPAGALTAMLLAKQGFKVDVFERLAPQRGAGGALQSTSAIGPRSYNILLTERAVLALEAAGADLSGFDIPDLQTTMHHKLKGGPAEGTASTPLGRPKLANRGVLAGALVQQCLAQHGDSVQFHFAQELCVFDLTSNIAFFRPVGSQAQGAAAAASSPTAPSGDGQAAADSGAAGSVAQAVPQPHTPAAPNGLATYPFDLLVGADGASSLVRQVLQRQDGALQVSAMRDIMEFKTFQMGSAERFLPKGTPAGSTFQTWTNPKLQATLIASSTASGQLRTVFILPQGVHDTLKTAGDYQAYLAQAFPSLPEDAIEMAAPQLVECPVSNGGTTIRCSKLNSRRVALVGDAAHAVVPSLGQGANAGLEGAATLAAVIQEVGTQDMEAAAAEYSRRWLANALAVADLSQTAFGNSACASAPNLKMAQLISQMLLHKVLPFLVPKPAFFLMNSTNTAYVTILERSNREMAVFVAVLAATAAAALAALWRFAARPAMAALGLA